MPSKPNISYKNLDIPLSLIKIANILANISLDTRRETQLCLLSFSDILHMFVQRYHKYIEEVSYLDENNIKYIKIAGFTFYNDGDIDFNLKEIVASNLQHLFNIDFYGLLREDQMLEFYDSLKPLESELEEINKWIKYKSYGKKQS